MKQTTTKGGEVKFKIGQIVDYYNFGGVISGEIVQYRKRFLCQPEYRVIYGIGDFGIRVASNAEWVKEKNILKVIKVRMMKGENK